jgi:hypothetical protein
MYRISREIQKLVEEMRLRILRMRLGERAARQQDSDAKKAEKAATDAVNRRRDRIGDTGRSDRSEAEPVTSRAEALTKEIVTDGVDIATARRIAVDYVNKKIKFRFRHADIPGQTIFDVNTTGGIILITLNTKHPVHQRLFEILRTEDEASGNSYPKEVLSLIAAWARLEDEAPSEKMRASIEELRLQWGRMAMDFFEVNEG